MKMILRWAQRFVVAYGIIMLATFFMCLFFNPTSQLAVVPFFGRCIVLTLVCMATLIVYYTKGELSVRAWWFRTILHTCLLEITLLPLHITGISGTARWMQSSTDPLSWEQKSCGTSSILDRVCGPQPK